MTNDPTELDAVLARIVGLLRQAGLDDRAEWIAVRRETLSTEPGSDHASAAHRELHGVVLGMGGLFDLNIPGLDGPADRLYLLTSTEMMNRPPTYVEFTSLIASDRPDDKAWVLFWSDNYHGLAPMHFPAFWEAVSSRRPGGTVREAIDAWPTEELKRLWLTHIWTQR